MTCNLDGGSVSNESSCLCASLKVSAPYNGILSSYAISSHAIVSSRKFAGYLPPRPRKKLRLADRRLPLPGWAPRSCSPSPGGRKNFTPILCEWVLPGESRESEGKGLTF